MTQSKQSRPVDKFVAMSKIWRNAVPSCFADDAPELLVAILEQARVAGGTSQKELLESLGIPQARLSRLMLKMRANGWLNDHSSPATGSDSRVRRVTATTDALKTINTINKELTAFEPAPNRRPKPTRRLAPAKMFGGRTLLDQL